MDKIIKLYLKGRWFYQHHLYLISKFYSKIIRRKYSCIVPPTAEIHKTVVFAHDGLGVVINASSIIEDNVLIYQNVTIGNRKSSKGPHICPGVLIGANALILGDITIGENSKIGAGAIVVDDVPPNSVVLCKKAEIIKEVF